MGRYFFSGALTKRLERVSVGFGYRFGAPLVLKFEYTNERGRMANGQSRETQDVLAAEVGMKF